MAVGEGEKGRESAVANRAQCPAPSLSSDRRGIQPGQAGLIPHAGGRIRRQADQKVKPLGGPPFEMGMGQGYQTENISKPRTAKELHIHALAYSSQATVFRESPQLN